MSRHREAFEAFAEEAEERLGDSLKKLVLYGSVARGEETEESDVDVFAVVETKEQKHLLQELGADIGVEHGVIIVPIVKTEDEYEDMEDTIYAREVRETGVAYV
ncbi:MAG: nucleotidyltransferase domain-containing protein [Candidatus Nanohaloarchaea archaeon]|nr:nucleotidyltransferase domain-containing protein [Candidatus Nanohaloarchaea archaeon]